MAGTRKLLRKAVIWGGDKTSKRGGTWLPAKAEKGNSAAMFCPRCGTLSSLAGYQIKENGDVYPAVRCVKPECPFHCAIQLENWEG